MTSRRKDYGPVQLAMFLALERWQFSRARQDGLIPAPDWHGGRWFAAVAGARLARIGQIRQAVGAVPDLGAFRAADVLSARLGVTVTGNGVEELARHGLLPQSGGFGDYPLYDGQAIEAFADPGAAEEPAEPGTCSSPTTRRRTCVSAAATSII